MKNDEEHRIDIDIDIDKQLSLENIKKLFSLFNYRVIEQNIGIVYDGQFSKDPTKNSYKIVDENDNGVMIKYDGYAYFGILHWSLDDLRDALYAAEEFYVSIKSNDIKSNDFNLLYYTNDIRISSHKNIFKGKSPYEMLITYDLIKDQFKNKATNV